MGFEPLDGIKLIMLMAAGLLFCCAGLYLLIRPKPEGSAAKIELFGLKFESSSAGLLVFLIGAAFLAVPMFVPEKAQVTVAQQDPPSVGTAPTAQDAAAPSTPQDADETVVATPIVTAQGKVKEAEPNDSIDTATPFDLGQIATGQTGSDGDIDWFVMAIPASGIRGHEIKLKHFNSNGNQVSAGLFNNREEAVGHLVAGNGATYLPIKSDLAEKLFFRLTGVDRFERGYELSVVAGEAN
jgi:hypothetical protein